MVFQPGPNTRACRDHVHACILQLYLVYVYLSLAPSLSLSLPLPTLSSSIYLSHTLRLAEASVVRISVLFVRRRCFCCFSAFQKCCLSVCPSACLSVCLSGFLSAYLAVFRFSRFYPALPLVAWTASVVKLALMCSRLQLIRYLFPLLSLSLSLSLPPLSLHTVFHMPICVLQQKDAISLRPRTLHTLSVSISFPLALSLSPSCLRKSALNDFKCICSLQSTENINYTLLTT